MSSTRINETGSKVTYECGCCIQRPSFFDYWQREYICGVHKEQLSELPPLTTVVNPVLTPEERDVVQAVLAMRQFECLRERREVSRCYIEGETRRIRLEAIDAESEALASAMKKLL